MSRTKRVIALLLVLAVVGGLVTSVAMWSLNNNPDNSTPGLYLKKKKVESPSFALKVNDHEVSFSEYRFFYLYTKQSMEQQNESSDIWGATGTQDTLKSDTESVIKEIYYWMDYATKNNIVLTDEEKTENEASFDLEVETSGLGEEAFLKASNADSKETQLRIYEISMLSTKAMAHYSDIVFENNKDALLEDAYTAKHILINFPQEEVPLEGDASSSVSASTGETSNDAVPASNADSLARADAILKEITESKDPIAAFEERIVLSEDPGSESSPNGYTFNKGAMVDEFYEATKALKVNEISALVESSFGYHIILRLPTDEAALKEGLLSSYGASMFPVSSAIWNEVFGIEAQALISGVLVTEGDYYDKISVTTVR